MKNPIIRVLLFLLLSVTLFNALGDDGFNCHNYAWEAERRWLDDPREHIASAVECDASEATRVVYYWGDTPIHSGLWLGNGWVESKWGSNPILITPWWCSPYGTHVKFYR